ncbi:MAG: hypothetical protein JSU68_07400, partial [Phycisphaerales bacterium]
GFLAGLAIGTFYRRRRWIIVISAVVLLWFGDAAYGPVRIAYNKMFLWPLRELVFGPPERPPYTPPLSVASTFAVGTTDASMAGRWEFRYPEQPEIPPGEVTFDAAGSLVRYVAYDQKLGRNIEFDADGTVHDLDAEIESDEVQITSTSYRVLSGCQHAGNAIILHVRVEMMMWARVEGRLMGWDLVTEEHFTGLLAEDGSQISGTSVLRVDAPFIRPEPDGLERPFVMIRVGEAPASQPTPP